MKEEEEREERRDVRVCQRYLLRREYDYLRMRERQRESGRCATGVLISLSTVLLKGGKYFLSVDTGDCLLTFCRL